MAGQRRPEAIQSDTPTGRDPSLCLFRADCVMCIQTPRAPEGERGGPQTITPIGVCQISTQEN